MPAPPPAVNCDQVKYHSPTTDHVFSPAPSAASSKGALYKPSVADCWRLLGDGPKPVGESLRPLMWGILSLGGEWGDGAGRIRKEGQDWTESRNAS